MPQAVLYVIKGQVRKRYGLRKEKRRRENPALFPCKGKSDEGKRQEKGGASCAGRRDGGIPRSAECRCGCGLSGRTAVRRESLRREFYRGGAGRGSGAGASVRRPDLSYGQYTDEAERAPAPYGLRAAARGEETGRRDRTGPRRRGVDPESLPGGGVAREHPDVGDGTRGGPLSEGAGLCPRGSGERAFTRGDPPSQTGEHRSGELHPRSDVLFLFRAVPDVELSRRTERQPRALRRNLPPSL